MSDRTGSAERPWSASEILAAVRAGGAAQRPNRRLAGKAGSGPEQSGAGAVVLAIVAGALGLERVELGLSFAEVGGDSLAATQILARVWQALDVRLPLSALAPDTRIDFFVELVRERAVAVADSEAATPAPRAGEARGPQPLSSGQAAIWLSAELGGAAATALATIPIALRLRGRLHRQALETALDRLVRRHDALSLRISADADGLRQERSDPRPLELAAAAAGSERRAFVLARDHVRRRRDRAEPPLLDPLLLGLGPEDHLLVLAVDHLACDAWSVKVLLGEFAALYNAIAAGDPAPPAGSSVGFLDFACWQRRLLARERERLIAFWRTALDGAPPPGWLPTDLPRPAERLGWGEVERLEVEPDLLTGLRALGGEEGVTTYMCVLAGFALVLADFSGCADLVIGSPMANRAHPRLAATVGYLSNTVPIRLGLEGDPTVRELLHRVRRASLAAYDHQELPLPDMLAALAPPREVGVPPLFQVCFVLNEMQAAPMDGLETEEVILHTATAGFDLTCYLEQRPGSLEGYLEYPVDLFRQETARRLADRLSRTLAAMAADPGAGAADLVAGLG